MMDFLRSQPGEDPVLVEHVFAAAPARVFRAWTDPDELLAWFGKAPNAFTHMQVDLRVGGQWRFLMASDGTSRRYLEGEYLDIEPARRLVFTWTYVVEKADGGREISPESRVTVHFESDGNATRVSLRHEGIRAEDARLGVTEGWGASFISLARHVDAD